MRTKEEIFNNYRCGTTIGGKSFSNVSDIIENQKLILEVLLDIRNLQEAKQCQQK
jgi:hypothetical protein